jgi:hypothetical protein
MNHRREPRWDPHDPRVDFFEQIGPLTRNGTAYEEVASIRDRQASLSQVTFEPKIAAAAESGIEREYCLA